MDTTTQAQEKVTLGKSTVDGVDNLISEILTDSKALMESDPDQLYLYPCPSEYAPVADPSENDNIVQLWPTISSFSFNKILNSIREYIDMWHTAPTYDCILIVKKNELHTKFGNCYFINAEFSRPSTAYASLSVRVSFEVYVSSVLPKYYPVMVTYKFETEDKRYYALGNKCDGAVDFQRSLIDFIMGKKYVKILERKVGDSL